VPQRARYFLRRVHKDQIRGDTLAYGAFKPNSGDIDGISIYDANLVTPDQLKENARNPPDHYRVAKVAESEFLRLGLSIVKTVDPGGLPGHHVVPEINFTAYKSSDPVHRAHLKQILDDLVNIADFAD
jgi:hypothetical protein